MPLHPVLLEKLNAALLPLPGLGMTLRGVQVQPVYEWLLRLPLSPVKR